MSSAREIKNSSGTKAAGGRHRRTSADQVQVRQVGNQGNRLLNIAPSTTWAAWCARRGSGYWRRCRCYPLLAFADTTQFGRLVGARAHRIPGSKAFAVGSSAPSAQTLQILRVPRLVAPPLTTRSSNRRR